VTGAKGPLLGPVGLMASKGVGELLTISLATRGLRKMKHTAEWLSRPYIVHRGRSTGAESAK
jgi:hypothetical protein